MNIPRTTIATYQYQYCEPWQPDPGLAELHASPRDKAERRLMWRALDCHRYDSYTDDQWEGAILIEIAKDKTLPEDWRRDATLLGRQMLKGYTLAAGARRAGLKYSRANSLIMSTNKQVKATPEIIDKVLALREQGLSYRLIAQDLGISYNQVVHIEQHYKQNAADQAPQGDTAPGRRQQQGYG